jgi:hypothetical protein
MKIDDALQKENDEIVATAAAITVATETDFNNAAGIVVKLRAIQKRIFDAVNPFVESANEAHKAAVAQRKKLLAPSETAEKALKDAMDAYARAEAEKKRKEEEAFRKKLEAAKTPEAAERIVAKAPAPTVLPKAAGVITVEEWGGTVVNAAILPREYLIPDYDKLLAITKTLKNDTQIPGWKPTMTVKTRGVRA